MLLSDYKTRPSSRCLIHVLLLSDRGVGLRDILDQDIVFGASP